MASIKEEIAAIAAEHGYTGPKPKSAAGAIDALADTLAGTDVKSGRSIAGAIHALAPYIGAGGGGAELGPLATINAFVSASTYPSMFVSFEQFDISGETQQTIFDAAMGHCIATAQLPAPSEFSQPGGVVASGAYVMLMGVTPTEVLADNIAVQVDGQTITTGYEAKVLFEGGNMYFVFVTMQVPQAQTVNIALTAPID